MKKLIAILCFLPLTAFAQKPPHPDSTSLAVRDRSPEVFSHESVCRIDKTKEICEVLIRFHSDTYPVEFINNGRVLLRLEQPPDSSIIVIRGVKYIPLSPRRWEYERDGVKYEMIAPGLSYQLDMKNTVGRSTILQDVGL